MFLPQDKICIIGAGRFAYSFTSAMVNNGYNVSCIISRSVESAKDLAEKFNIGIYSGSIADSPNEIRIFFITVPDDEIRRTAENISKLKFKLENKLFIHSSGALDISLLNSLSRKKAFIGGFHIMQTFPSRNVINIAGATSAIESESQEVVDYLISLSKNLKLNPLVLKPDEKPFYHLAGVFASNFLAGNLHTAEQLLSADKKFFRLFKNIIYTTLENIEQNGTANSLSGPVARGDVETIKKHISILSKEEKTRNILISYIAQCLILTDIALYNSKKESMEELRKYLLKKLNEVVKTGLLD